MSTNPYSTITALQVSDTGRYLETSEGVPFSGLVTRLGNFCIV